MNAGGPQAPLRRNSSVAPRTRARSAAPSRDARTRREGGGRGRTIGTSDTPALWKADTRRALLDPSISRSVRLRRCSSSNSRAWRAATHAPAFVAEAGVTEPAARALCLVRCDRERGAPRPLQTGRMGQSWSRAGATSGGAAEDLTCRVVGWPPGEHGGGGEGRLRHRGRQEPGAGQAARPQTSVRVWCLWWAMSTPRRAFDRATEHVDQGGRRSRSSGGRDGVAICGW
jgi:hypothetical protein